MVERTVELADLASVKTEDAEAFLAAAEHAQVRSCVYYFPSLYFNMLRWERHAGSILVYQVSRRKVGSQMNLYLPPFPFDPAALRHARQRMRDFNGDRSGRILFVQEGDALRIAREGLAIYFRTEEFIFDRAAVMALEGPGFYRLRQELSRAVRPGLVETRPYTAADQPACLALVEAWRKRLNSDGIKPTSYYRHMVACLAAAKRFPPSLLNGLVAEVNGEVRGFAFSGPLTSTVGCDYICITDTSFRGLAYLLRYRLMAGFPDLIHFNDSVDSGRPGLRELKQRFRPVEMHALFGAREGTDTRVLQSMSDSGFARGNGYKTEQSKNKKLIHSMIRKGENDFSRSPYISWKGDIARVLISDAALCRGYKVDTERDWTFRVCNEDTSWIFDQNDPEGSMVADIIQSDKHLTKVVVSRHGIPVPVGAVFTEQSAALEYFLSRKRSQVVKPLQGSGGNGVTAGVRDERAFSTAWQNARARARRIVVEDFFEGDEVRINVLGGRAVAAVCRVPAFVVGDGASSISQLVFEKNKLRRNNPLLKICPIKKFDQLELDGRSLDEVPAENEYVRLSTVSNVGQGGDGVAVLDHLHPSIIDIAEKAFRAIPGATLLGLDVLVKDFSAEATKENVCMVELNTNPAIAGPVFPTYGSPIPTLPNDLLDFVASGHYETARRADWNGKPVASPAPICIPQFDGGSFGGGDSTQVRLLRQAAYARNLLVDALDDELTLISNGERSTGFFQGIPSCTRNVARRASINKEWTKTLLQRANIRAPEGKVFSVEAREDAWQFAQKLAGVSTVVKPITGSGGKGVSTDIFRRADFDLAWKVASETGTKSILVEQYCPGKSYRLLVIGNAVRAVAERIPAHVVGDGVHTIEQLVASKNEQRRKNPYIGANLIKLTPMTLHKLALAGMSQLSVPEAGQDLQLHSTASIGLGGEARDVSDLLHAGFSVIADKVRKAMYDPLHIGIDLIAEDVTLSPEKQTWAVVGVNANPEFGMHQFNSADLSRDVAGVAPEFGVHQFRSASLSRDVAGALIEAVFPEAQTTSIPNKSIRVLIEGKVQDPGFRDWVWRHAHLHMLGGWVRSRRDGRVEALFSGASNAVDQMIKQCGDGPKGGVVTKVDIIHVAD